MRVVVNRLAGIILALLLIAVGLFVIAQTVLFLTGRSPWLVPLESWRDRLAGTELADRTVLVVSIVAVVIGLAVLFLQLRRVTPTRLLSQHSGDPDAQPRAQWWLQRRSVERRTAAAAQSVWGVHDVKAHAHGRPAAWELAVTGSGGDGAEATGAVEAAVHRELARLTAPADVPVSVSLRHSRRVV
jgi:hypothetical protein